MTPATATETATETPDEWRKRRSAELRAEYRGAWPGLGSREPFRVAILQAEEALWWGFERGLAEQRELVRELRESLERTARRFHTEAKGDSSFDRCPNDVCRDARALIARTEAQR